MRHSYFLVELIVLMFFASFISARELSSKPIILIVPMNSVIGFESFIKNLSEPNFVVKEKNLRDITSDDLHKISYLLIYGWLNQNELTRIPTILTEPIKKFNNKGIVILNQPGFPPRVIDEDLKHLFNDQVFQLDMKFGLKGVEFIQDIKSEEFKRLFQDKLEMLITIKPHMPAV